LASDDVEIAASATFGPAALTWAKTSEPDVAIVVTEESLARPVATIQALAQGDPSWTVVALADRFERDLVRQAMLAGARDVIVRTSTPAELRQALVTARQADLARRRPDGEPVRPGGTVITLCGVKGGIGKTTVSINLALALAAESERSVAIVDLDLPYGDLAMLLNLKPETSIVTALSDAATLKDPELLQRQLCAGPGRVSVLAAPLTASGPAIEGAQVAHLLTRIAGLYDFVVVDTPGGFGEYTAAALDAATRTVMMTTPEAPTLRRTELGLKQLANWNYPTTRLDVLLNRATLKTGIPADQVAAILSQPVRWWLPDEPAALQASAAGEPVVLSQPRTQMAQMMRAMARQVAGLPEPATRPRSFLNWRARPTLAVAQV
jgi:pilus assembly protein CpaE